VDCAEGEDETVEGYDDGVPAPLHPWHMGYELDVDGAAVALPR